MSTHQQPSDRLPSRAHQALTVADLSVDQRAAHDGVRTWLNRTVSTKPTLTLAGFAGTGKSSVVAVLAQEMIKRGSVAFCSYTGKAASVLGQKLRVAGIETAPRCAPRMSPAGTARFEGRPYCGTIHGLVYRPCELCMIVETREHTFGPDCVESNSNPEEDLAEMIEDHTRCLACHPLPVVKRDGPCLRCNGARYLRRQRLDRPYRLIVVDEASMVSDDILDTLLSFCVPILAVGDHGQLPPVRGQGSLMVAPDLRLETIHRQAEGNPIIALSARIRATGNIDDRLEDGKAFTILARRNLAGWINQRFPPARRGVDPTLPAGILGTVLLSYTNKLRVTLNRDVRAALGLTDEALQSGEVMICLKNKPPIYNGMRGVLLRDTERAGDAGGKAPKWKASIDFVEDQQTAIDILLSEYQVFAEKTLVYEDAQKLGVSMAQLGELYDMGYALTCHKMQGSQAPEVAVVVEDALRRMGQDERTRWMYTAVTRSSERLTVIR